MEHQYHKCNKNDCFICEGGLLYCEVCHLGEVELVSDECAGGLTQRAVDEGESAPLQAESTPEHLPIEEADTTPALRN